MRYKDVGEQKGEERERRRDKEEDEEDIKRESKEYESLSHKYIFRNDCSHRVAPRAFSAH